MKGCAASPVPGFRKLLAKWFSVQDMDEYRTSKTCNDCSGALARYRRRDGKLSHSRLFCDNYAGRPKDRSKQFVDRDLNTARNILLAGK